MLWKVSLLKTMKRHSIGTAALLTLSCFANQWTGFYMITASIMKVLKGFLKHFAKFTEKQLRWSPFYSKLAVIDLQLYYKKDLHHKYFFSEFYETLQNSFTLIQLLFLHRLHYIWTFLIFWNSLQILQKINEFPPDVWAGTSEAFSGIFCPNLKAT